jgi:type IV pilus assembly protein PilE
MQTLITSRATETLPRRNRGFTLIELVVAMVIAATLAAIAIPAYSNYVRKARRVEVKTALLDIASLEERYYSTQNAYTANLSDLGYGAGTSVTLPSTYYSVAAPTILAATAPTTTTAGSPASWTVTATAVLDQLKDTSCRTFTVTSAGLQTSADASSVDTTSTCWK